MPRATSWVTRRHSSVIRSVRLRQVHETNLVVAAPKELLAHLECYSVLGEAAKCGATFFSRGDDGGAGAKKADDARSAAVHRGDEQRGEPASGVLPNPGPRRRPLAANCRLAPRGHVRPRTVVYSYSGALTPKRCLCGFPHFATSRRDAQQLLVAQGRASPGCTVRQYYVEILTGVMPVYHDFRCDIAWQIGTHAREKIKTATIRSQ